MSIQNIILIVAVIAVIGFMFYTSRRNRKRQADLRSAIQPGVEVMTNFGLFGKLLSVDEGTNVAEVETSPGTIVRVHRQTLSKVVTPEELAPVTASGDAPRSVEEAMAIANREQAEREAAAKVDSEAPAYGERIDDPITKATTKAPAKRAPRAPKATDN